MKLDPWQEEVLKTEGNICLRSGRQVGKSTVIGVKCARYALNHKDKLIMVISKTERQAGLLFAKILHNIHLQAKGMIMTGRNKPTKHKLSLKNGSVIHCLPAGDTGFGIMGFTIDLLIADEAAFIPEEVWNSIIPALAVTKGNIWLLSTPFVKKGYYYDCFQDDSFTAFHTSSEDCPRRDDLFLARQKQNLTRAQYAQMYLGEFVDELLAFFPEELIRKICVGKRPKVIDKYRRFSLGCDVARKENDEFTFEIIDYTNPKHIIHVENIFTTDTPIPESSRRIIELNEKYGFSKEYIDSGGMGIAVCDILREDSKNRRKVVEINNAARRLTIDGEERKKGIIKEDLYNNLKRLMQHDRIILLDDDEVKASLRCIQTERNPATGRIKIWGDDSHIVEGLIRAVFITKDKSLNIWGIFA